MILEIKKVTLPELPFLRIDVQLNAFLFYIQHDYYTIKNQEHKFSFVLFIAFVGRKRALLF